MSTPQFIVFTDLDGTLLDHDTYEWAQAQPALDLLKMRGIPLILASSKTAAEIAPLRASLGFEHCPAIVENGAGILQSGASPETDTLNYQRIRAALNEIPHTLRHHFTGFADMGVDGIVEATGLPSEQARLAATRAFSEPGLWSGTNDQQTEFEGELAARGIVARSGGRFLTLSFGNTKAGQMQAICDTLFEPGQTVHKIALGDAPNDTEMLLAADTAFIIHNIHAKPIVFPPKASTGHVTKIAEKSPLGWNQAVLSIVSPK